MGGFVGVYQRLSWRKAHQGRPEWKALMVSARGYRGVKYPMGGNMARKSARWEELGCRMREAAGRRQCYVADGYQEARLLRRRAISGDVAEPFPGLFAFEEY